VSDKSHSYVWVDAVACACKSWHWLSYVWLESISYAWFDTFMCDCTSGTHVDESCRIYRRGRGRQRERENERTRERAKVPVWLCVCAGGEIEGERECVKHAWVIDMKHIFYNTYIRIFIYMYMMYVYTYICICISIRWVWVCVCVCVCVENERLMWSTPAPDRFNPRKT